MSKPYLPLSDEALIESLKKEEPGAFEHIYRQYYRLVSSYVTRHSGSEEDAKDIFQEMLIVLVRAIRKPEFQLYQNTKFSTYIHGISSKMWLMKLRSRKPFAAESELEKLPADDDFGIAEGEHIFEQKHLALSKVFQKIGEDCRKLLDAFYSQKTALKDIALAMNYTEAFVRVKKNRCMNEFRKKITEDPDYQQFQIEQQ